MPLTTTLSYDALTRTATLTETAAPTGGRYALVRLRAGRAAEPLASVAVPGGAAYAVPADGAYRLQLLRAGVPLLSITADAGAELLHVDTADHDEAIARAYEQHTRRAQRKGHPLEDAERVACRRDEAVVCVSEHNTLKADELLSTTIFPR